MAIRKVCAKFIALCRQMGLLQTPSVAIDGSKFKAVNNHDRNFTHAKAARRMAQSEESVGRYPRQLDSADRQEPPEAISIKTARIKEKIARLKQEVSRLEVLDAQMRNTPDQQISLTDPDAGSMATSGRGSGVVGYNVQVAVDTEHHLIVTHEVINVGNDRGQLARMSKASQRSARSGQTRGGRRPWLLRRRRDTSLRRGWRCSHLAQAHDVERQGGGPVRQTGLRLPA